MSEQYCNTCEYWKPLSGARKLHGTGYCKYGPPTTVPNSSLHIITAMWPITDPDDWCGQHVSNDQAEE